MKILRLPVLIIIITISLFNSCKNESGQAIITANRLGFYLPEDLDVTLWAESPGFYNPTNMDVDIKGRIWITEAVNYRNFNNDSLHHLHFSKGDRVMILEDRDGDGKADTSKVFVEDKDLVSPLGIAVIDNKVIVACSPNIIIYTDTDGDDHADKKEIFLTGFGGLDHDHSLHATVAGPDGKWYFNTGNAGPHIVKDKAGWTLRAGSIYTGGTPYNTKNEGGMKSDDGKIWVGGLTLRIDPDGKGLHVMGHNYRNSYEATIDSYGNLWQNDNDDQVLTCRTTWLMEGGNAGYFSNDGTRSWAADQRPGQDMFTAQWHQDDPDVMYAGDNSGAGAPTGIVLNESDALGEAYKGMLFSADAGRNTVFGYHPLIKGSGYELRGRRENFFSSLPADNAHYVWNDSAQNSNTKMWFRPSDVCFGTDGAMYIADWYDPVVGGHQMKDSLGYGRIYRVTPKNKKLISPVYNLSTINGQLEVLKSPAVNVRAAGFNRLVAQGDKIIPAVLPMLSSTNEYYRARAVWLLSRLGGNGIAAAEKQLTNPDRQLRVAAFRALRQTGKDILPWCSALVNDTSAMVRREVAIALKDLPFDKSKPLLLQLINSYDGNDAWYLYALGLPAAGHGDELYPEILKTNGNDSEKWTPKLSNLLWRLHPLKAVPLLNKWAADSTLTADARKKAITALAFIEEPSAVNAMLKLAANKLPDVNSQALYWLAYRKDNDWYALIDWKKTGLDLDHEKKNSAMKVFAGKALNTDLTFNDRKEALEEMIKDSAGGQMIMGMLSQNKLGKALDSVIEKKIFTNPDLSVRVQAGNYFKQKGTQTKFAIDDIVKIVPDAGNGHQIFLAKCATCHRVGKEGNDIGPELTMIQKKLDKTALVDAIIHPSAAIVFGFEPWLVNKKDSTSLFGFLLADGKTVILKDVSGKKHTIHEKNILTKKKMDYSLMPEPETLELSEKNIADVVGFLRR